jgi:hypothetical protein
MVWESISRRHFLIIGCYLAKTVVRGPLTIVVCSNKSIGQRWTELKFKNACARAGTCLFSTNQNFECAKCAYHQIFCESFIHLMWQFLKYLSPYIIYAYLNSKFDF